MFTALMNSAGEIRTHDLQVMGLASYHCSTARRWPVLSHSQDLPLAGRDQHSHQPLSSQAVLSHTQDLCGLD